jgi:hypothetical protein
MAKKSSGPNKSAAIRDYLGANKNAKPREIVTAMKEQGIDVTPQFVSTIKTKFVSGGGKSPKRRGRPRKTAAAKKSVKRTTVKKSSTGASAGKVSTGAYDDLVVAKKLADQLGGVDQARAALAALEKITG